MSSITTAVPSGTGYDWCIKQLYANFGSTEIAQCANSSRGTTESDFETICCDGMIIDQTQNLYSWEPRNGPTYVDLANLVCCQIEGPQMGGLQPIAPDNGLTCTTGTPTPLASMAATNTANAQIYPLTFTSASGVSPNIGDMLWTGTPYCLWADTAHGVAMMEVTVPAATISTLPIGWPNSNDPLIVAATPTSTFGVPPGADVTSDGEDSGTLVGDASTASASSPAVTGSYNTLEGVQPVISSATAMSTTSGSSIALPQVDKVIIIAAVASLFKAWIR